VKSLKLLGRSNLASGRYVDLEKESRNKAKAKADSLIQAQKHKLDAYAVDKRNVKNNNMDKSKK
jgi:hypothetical protein